MSQTTLCGYVNDYIRHYIRDRVQPFIHDLLPKVRIHTSVTVIAYKIKHLKEALSVKMK